MVNEEQGKEEEVRRLPALVNRRDARRSVLAASSCVVE
jgi:hypothetical protein